LCKQHNILVYNKNDVFDLHSEYAIAISWRWMIDVSERKLIVLHDSILPKYRGFAPLVMALINGDSEIGVTALFANNSGYDKGDIIIQDRLAITYPIKINKAIELISELYCSITVKLIETINKSNDIVSVKQCEIEATYSLWRDEDDYFIDWAKESEQIKRFIDALGYPYKNAKTKTDNKVIRIKEAEVVADVNISNRDIGKIIFVDDGFPIVVCGKGLIKITSAYYEESGKDFFPISKFRIKFTSV